MKKEHLEISEADSIRVTDRRWSKTWPQHLAAGLAALSVVCAGAVDGWTSAAIPYLEQPYILADNVTVPGITYREGSWIASLSPLGSLVGAIPAGHLADLLGRRFLMLIMAVPMLVGWIMKVFAHNSIPVLYTARFILGFTCGIATVAFPLYSDEIAEVRVRGTLGVYLNLMFCVGILYVYIFGAILPYVWMTIACTVLPVLFAVTFYWMPESPLHLLNKGKTDKAKESLRWLRGVRIRHSAEIRDELEEMQSFIRGYEEITSDSSTHRTILSKFIGFFRSISVTTVKAMNIIFGLMIFRQWCGVNALEAYAVEIFQSAGSSVDPYLCTIIYGIIQLVSSCIPTFIVDRVGRRILLIISGMGMAVSLLAMVFRFFTVNKGIEIKHLGWLPLISINLYIIAFSIGFGPLPWFIMPELLSNEAKRWVSPIAVCLTWAMSFLVTKFFPIMINDMGSEATYQTLFVFCLVGTVFVVVFVPETKGRTREEIHRQLSRK
jgi:SP family facilitated glucose transporter-like MFS transporter 8